VCALAVALCAATAAAAGASTASARGLITGFTDNNVFDPSAPSSVNQQQWLDRATAAHGKMIRITVDWRNSLRRKPRDPANPADPAYGFQRLDQAVRMAKASGHEVLLTVYRAPDWAEGADPPANVQPGAWKPNPVQYGKFGQALARRYSGTFHGLPRVHYFEVWTEPNLTQFLAPQWEGKKVFAPVRYRALLNNFYAGVHAAQPGATVVGGATSPFGDSRKHQLYPDHPRMHPIAFLRTALCLNSKYKRAKGCNSNAVHLDALSAHPLNIRNGPHYKPRSKDDTQVANFSRVRQVLRAAERVHAVAGSKHQLWVTESGILSDPPNPKGVPLPKHARWVEESLYLLWKQGASVVLNLNIRDPAYNRHHSPSGQWTTGIYTHAGKAKPAFKAWRFPFLTHRKSKKKVKAWVKPPVGGKLVIQQKRHGKWRTRKRLEVLADQIVQPALRVRGKAKLRAKVGRVTSITWPQSR
jgi:hypothetical protein